MQQKYTALAVGLSSFSFLYTKVSVAVYQKLFILSIEKNLNLISSNFLVWAQQYLSKQLQNTTARRIHVTNYYRQTEYKTGSDAMGLIKIYQEGQNFVIRLYDGMTSTREALMFTAISGRKVQVISFPQATINYILIIAEAIV